MPSSVAGLRVRGIASAAVSSCSTCWIVSGFLGRIGRGVPRWPRRFRDEVRRLDLR